MSPALADRFFTTSTTKPVGIIQANSSKLFPLLLLAFLMETSLKVGAYSFPSLLLLPSDRNWCLLMWPLMAYHAVAPFLENCK